VLTDYDAMPRFLSHLEVSRIEARTAAGVRVYQKGVVAGGPFSFRFENVREMRLTPLRLIQARFVAGDLASSEFETELAERGAALHVLNRGRYVSTIPVPPVVGRLLIAAETRRQFVELRSEMERRQRMQGRGDATPTPGAAASLAPVSR
jgi:hypothetical protein